MITTRMATTALALGALAAILTGCSGTTTAGIADTSPSPAATAEASVAEETEPVSSKPLPTTCPEFMMTAAHLATYWQYLNINLGTTNDEGPTLADLRDGSAAMQDLAPTCAPKAVEEIDAFAATVGPVLQVYTTQPEGEQVQQVDDALAEMQSAGAAMFTALDMATYAWED